MMNLNLFSEFFIEYLGRSVHSKKNKYCYSLKNSVAQVIYVGNQNKIFENSRSNIKKTK